MNDTRDLGYLRTPTEFHPLASCPWCGNDELEHVATRGDGLPVLGCPACALRFLGALPEDISVFYDEDYYVRSPIPGTAPAVSGYEDYERSFSPSSFRWLTSLISGALGGTGRLFDLGAATGTFLEMARYEGFDVHGVELTEEGSAAAREKGLDVRTGMFDADDWPPGSFDVVTALEVLEHVTDLRETLVGLGRLLAPDGLLVFFVPNVTDEIIQRYGDDALDFNKSFDHTLFFNPRALERIFAETFGEDALTLFTANVEQWGQQVSSALGFVRKRPNPDRPERRLFDIVNGDLEPTMIDTPDEATAVALTAAKFFQPELADAALARGEALGLTGPGLATVRAQVLRNRGEIINAIEILEPHIRSGRHRDDPIAPSLLVEVLEDLMTHLGIEEPGLTAGIRAIHASFDSKNVLRRALAQIEAREEDLVARAQAAERRANDAEERIEAERRRANDVERRHAVAMAEFGNLEADLADVQARADAATARAAALSEDNGRLRDTLNDIYRSRAWRLTTTAWKLKALLRGRRAQRTDSPAARDHAAGSTSTPRLPETTFPVTVSVIMPVYNKGDTLASSIASVQAQTYRDLEIVIWDDGSTDTATREAIDAAAELDTVTVFRADNQGVVHARNAAMSFARGEFFVCLDPDDRIAPTYIEKAVAYLRSHPEISIVYPWQRSVGDLEERWETQDLDPGRIAAVNHVPVCAMFRREVYTATGGFSDRMAGGFEDWEFWAHAAELGFRGRVIPEALFEYVYSNDPTRSRDATSRHLYDELAGRIGALHPTLAGARERPLAGVPAPGRLDLAPPVLPPGSGRPVILMLPWFTMGGADRVVEALIAHWRSSGRTVIAVTTLGVGDGMVDRFEQLLELTPYAYHLPHIVPESHWYDFVERIVDALGAATIVNVGSTWLHDNAARLKRAHPELRIVDQQFNDAGHIDGNRKAASAIDLTVTAYDGLRDRFLEDGRPDDQVTSIYVGIEPAAVAERDAAAVLASFGLGAPERFVVFVGRLSEEKRPGWLLPLADELGRHDIKTLVIGTGPLVEELGPRFERHPHLVWSTHVDDVMPIYAAAEATVLPSRVEGIPLTVMESLAAATPVVATAVGGLPELKDVPGLHLVDPDDRSGFIHQTLTVVESPTTDAVALPEEMTLRGMLERYDAVVDPG